ncbi:hypothetical protein M0R04_09045 [Candidatus Dojkabacteria bacterium]|jgi:ribosomal protein S27AE|nr:hypothetical protein [Candidatus Dojkabacteria bacterium]
MAKTLFDNMKKVYRINVRCTNCGEFSELTIPKGVTIESYLKSEIARCSNCGVNSLVKYSYPQPDSRPQSQPQPKIVFGNDFNKSRTNRR